MYNGNHVMWPIGSVVGHLLHNPPVWSCSGEEAYLKIRAGATLVQLYTAFAYESPSMLPRVKAELAACLERDGFKSVQDAVGADHHS
ncbi:unnamed protein product [Sphagnum jensenii]|uniref:Dihydroorotate dehydrogenase catalytic domain-containing protein n=1 Tax=Sphagnum jensenii TaxID=128206 RepID=A0ABP0W644_9BRYO